MLITSRPRGADSERILLTATDGALAEKIHDAVAAKYPDHNLTTRVGKATGVVAAPTGAFERIAAIVASVAPAAAEAPVEAPAAGDNGDALMILCQIAEVDAWEAGAVGREDVIGLLAEVEEGVLRAIVGAALAASGVS